MPARGSGAKGGRYSSTKTIVLVRNIGPSVTKSHLKRIFRLIGEIRWIEVEEEQGSSASIQFYRAEDAEEAQRCFDLGEIDGRTIYLSLRAEKDHKRRSRNGRDARTDSRKGDRKRDRRQRERLPARETRDDKPSRTRERERARKSSRRKQDQRKPSKDEHNKVRDKKRQSRRRRSPSSSESYDSYSSYTSYSYDSYSSETSSSRSKRGKKRQRVARKKSSQEKPAKKKA